MARRSGYPSLWAFLGLGVLILGMLAMVRDLRVLSRIKRESFIFRKIGRVRILINDHISVPFSFWLPGQAHIVMPTSIVPRMSDFRMAIAHELQHHRHGDTRWVYVLWGMKLICMANPAIHLWSRWISEVQEFACDETLVDHKKVESQAYARCLVEVAETAANQMQGPVCATGLTFLVERNLLSRRIEKMFKAPRARIGRAISIGFGFLAAAAMGATASASKSWSRIVE